MTDIPHQLREQCERLRRTSAPVSEVIPLMQLAADEIEIERQHTKAAQGMRLLLVPALQGEIDRLSDMLTVYGLGAHPDKTKHEIRDEIMRGRSEAARTAMADGRHHD